jgi:hypothetical protein
MDDVGIYYNNIHNRDMRVGDECFDAEAEGSEGIT